MNILEIFYMIGCWLTMSLEISFIVKGKIEGYDARGILNDLELTTFKVIIGSMIIALMSWVGFFLLIEIAILDN